MTNADLLYFDPLGMGGENRYETEKGEVERYAKDYLDIDTGRAGALGDSLDKMGVGVLELMGRLFILPPAQFFIALSGQPDIALTIGKDQPEYFAGIGRGIVETFSSPQNFIASFGLTFSEQEQAVLAEAWGKGDAEAIKAVIANKDARLLISVAAVAGGKVVVGAVEKPVAGEIASAAGGGTFSEIVPGGGLAAHEAAGGHLLARHVGKTEADLATRLSAQPSLKEVSTFISRAEAESAISGALNARAADVNAWVAAGAPDRLILNAPFNGGSVLQRGASATVSSTGVKVVLEGTGGGNWRIITGYPIP
jgi:hypothetical protein